MAELSESDFQRPLPVSPVGTPVYRRRRVPESYQFFGLPDLGTIDIGFGGSFSAGDSWRVTVPGRQITLQDNYVNFVEVVGAIWSVFENSGTGTNQAFVTGWPYLLRCFPNPGNSQQFDLWGVMDVTGRPSRHELNCPVRAFEFHLYGGNVFQTELDNSSGNWSGVGSSFVTFL